MDPYELYEKDFDEFVRLGIESFFGDHPGAKERKEDAIKRSEADM